MSEAIAPFLPADVATEHAAWPARVNVIGSVVTPTTYEEAVEVICAAGLRNESAVVSCHAVHAVVTAACDPALREKVRTFEMVTPDGQPVRWALNLLHKAGLKERVYGPELTLRLCRRAEELELPIYLYGAAESTLEKLIANLKTMFPNLVIAGSESPPFRQLTEEEDAAVVERINRSGAGIVFIGLGCPKQDHFAHDHRDRIKAVQVCVGAAFDFHAGTLAQAPAWMQRRGLEWFYRLYKEPRRLFRRYLTTNSIFLWKLGLDWVRPRKLAPQEPVSHSASQ